MIWRVIIDDDAEKTISKMPLNVRKRIIGAIDGLWCGPYDCNLDIKPLHARPEWRLKVGRWRVLFLVDRGNITITVVAAGARGDIYK